MEGLIDLFSSVVRVIEHRERYWSHNDWIDEMNVRQI